MEEASSTIIALVGRLAGTAGHTSTLVGVAFLDVARVHNYDYWMQNLIASECGLEMAR